MQCAMSSFECVIAHLGGKKRVQHNVQSALLYTPPYMGGVVNALHILLHIASSTFLQIFSLQSKIAHSPKGK